MAIEEARRTVSLEQMLVQAREVLRSHNSSIELGELRDHIADLQEQVAVEGGQRMRLEEDQLLLANELRERQLEESETLEKVASLEEQLRGFQAKAAPADTEHTGNSVRHGGFVPSLFLHNLWVPNRADLESHPLFTHRGLDVVPRTFSPKFQNPCWCPPPHSLATTAL